MTNYGLAYHYTDHAKWSAFKINASQKCINDIISWCLMNTKGQWSISVKPNWKFYFADTSDATLFALVWL